MKRTLNLLASYSFRDLFENKQEYCIAEAAEFFHFDFKRKMLNFS